MTKITINNTNTHITNNGKEYRYISTQYALQANKRNAHVSIKVEYFSKKLAKWLEVKNWDTIDRMIKLRNAVI